MAERRAKEGEDTGTEKDGTSAPATPGRGPHTEEKRRADAAIEPPGDAAPAKNGSRAKDESAAGGAHSIAPPPAAGPWRSYKEIVAQLAGRIVEAQRPIRVLQALRWDDAIEEQFFKGRQREMPKVDAAYYEGVDLGFDPREKIDEFERIAPAI